MIGENNKINLTGEIIDKWEYCTSYDDEKFYKTIICVNRKSSTSDYLPIVVSEKLVNPKIDLTGKRLAVSGSVRSRSYDDERGHHTEIYCFVDEVGNGEGLEDLNKFEFTGFITRQPKYRETPNGWKISDILLAVQRGNGKSDYLPCNAWNRNAQLASSLNPGAKINCVGRFQSRLYTKKYEDGTTENKETYEISIATMDLEGEAYAYN